MFKNKDKSDFLLEEDARGYITLKEASALSNYSADYIGQLIRAGKLEGKQVYSNVAWVTTEESVRSYMQERGKGGAPEQRNGFVHQHGETIARFFLMAVITFCAACLVVLLYVLAVTIDHQLTRSYVEESSTDM